jgi:formylglycine-generating enzyme required for sulfatase activity
MRYFIEMKKHFIDHHIHKVILYLILIIGCEPSKNVATIVLAQTAPSQCADSVTGKGSPMCLVPSGEFKMGCGPEDKQTCDAETDAPFSTAHTDEFYMDQHEVTVAEYAECVKSGKCKSAGLSNQLREDCGGFDTAVDESCNWNTDRVDHPVNCIPWEYARDYCAWAGKRLPTEAEWEKAARGTDGRQHPWGDKDIESGKQYANIADVSVGNEMEGPAAFFGKKMSSDTYDDGFKSTSPVEHYPEGLSPYGLYDMGGNVWEWVDGLHDSFYYNDDEPKKKQWAKFRMLKGGSYLSSPSEKLAYDRTFVIPNRKFSTFGFRCAADVATVKSQIQ